MLCSYQQEMPVFFSVKSTQLRPFLGDSHRAPVACRWLRCKLSQPWGLCFLVSHVKALQTHLQVLETDLSIFLSLQRVGFWVHGAGIVLCLPKIIWSFFFLQSHVSSRHLYFHINTVQFLSLTQTLKAKAVTRSKWELHFIFHLR